MISMVSGQRLEFIERVLVVDAGQRPAIEAVLRSCNREAEWSLSVSVAEPYCDFEAGNVANVWTMSVANIEDARVIQSALDAVA